MLVQAPAKLNLCLYLGDRRADGLHRLCSLFEPLGLCDQIEVSRGERDEVHCPGVEGENLASAGLGSPALGGLERAAAAGARSRSESRSRPGWAAAAQMRRRSSPSPPERLRIWRRSPPRSAPTCRPN